MSLMNKDILFLQLANCVCLCYTETAAALTDNDDDEITNKQLFV